MNTQEPIRVIIEIGQESVADFLLNPNTIIAITAILVSIISLWLTVKYNRKTLTLTLKHNKLSVRPFINFNYSVLNNVLNIDVVNNGLGPAIINSLIYKDDRRDYKRLSDYFNDNIDNYSNKKTDSSFSTFLSGEYIIAPNEKVILYHCEFKNNSYLNEAENLLSDIDVFAVYKSMYDEVKELKGKIKS